MFGYDYINAIGDRYDRIYSYGSVGERSFYQNVGKIINKQAFTERPDDIVEKVFYNIEKVMTGESQKEKK